MTNSTRRNTLLAILLLAGAALPVAAFQAPAAPAAPAAAQQPGKIKVNTADDLPRHTYKIEGAASEFFISDAPFKAFLQKVKADVASDLAKYDITDRTTLQEYHVLQQQIAMLEGRWDDALAFAAKAKEIEAKESKKLMTGQVLGALVEATKAAGGDKAKFDALFSENLLKRIAALPWETVREEVLQAKGRGEIISRNLVLGSIKSQVDPIVAQANGEVSGDVARPLIASRAALDVMLPLMPSIVKTYTTIIDSHKTVMKDVLSERNVTLTDKDPGQPVVVAIWDSGVDVSLFKNNVWSNPKEIPGNGKDDDKNGFADDVNGIAFDMYANPVPELLHPLTQMHGDSKIVTAHMKGMMDLQANIDSPEASSLKKYMSSLKPDDVKNFREDMGLFGNYSHGTHVAGIAAEGNPFVRLLAARISFDWHVIPEITPSVEQATKEAKVATDTIAYFKAAGVRVVNMSWGGSRKDVEDALEAKGVGASPAERAELSRKLFNIQKDALETAMKNAPDILFVAAAGNSDNDNQFAEFIPSGLSLPNMITIGAVDSSGKPTGFTTFGKNVKLYANGFEVNSYIPGGQKMKFSGTSMAAPNVTNLAGKLVALNPKLTTAQVIDIITRGAEPMEGKPDLLVINPKKSIGMIKPAN